MPEIPNSIRKIISKYISALEDNNFHIQRAILFGSHATGKANEWSDIDIALVSESFIGDRFDDRANIRKITLSVSSDLSPIPFRPEDFVSENPFAKEIMEIGIRIV
jgi:predicted nucleotidyltransferase